VFFRIHVTRPLACSRAASGSPIEPDANPLDVIPQRQMPDRHEAVSEAFERQFVQAVAGVESDLEVLDFEIEERR
jgi:hypothetical protein